MRPTAHSALRHCFYFPILHTSADLGCIAPQLDKAATDAAARERRRAEIDGIWADIEKIVLELDLDFTKTQVYQDGLPICGWEAQIVDELARTGSLNHRLLQALRERGATLMGTESPELLTAEHQLAMQVLDARGSAAEQTASQHALAADLLERRDRFIARRIDETLPPGHTGLLFIGALHRVALFLPTDIVVTYPIGMPR